MAGVILAVLDHPREAPGLLASAGCLGELIGGARINALIVRIPPAATVLPSEEVLTKLQENQVRTREGLRAAELTRAFETWTPPSGSNAQLVDIEAIPTAAVTKRGSAADFLVIERPARRDYGTTWHAIHAALFETDRPVLVVPPGHEGRFGRRVALAWRQDNRTTKTVLASLRCLGQAERVYVLAGQREGAARPRVPEILAEHGVPAELHVFPIGPQVFGDALLAKAHAFGADMIVMGAYVHDPIRRMALGGVTRRMLAGSNLPLLMRH